MISRCLKTGLMLGLLLGVSLGSPDRSWPISKAYAQDDNDDDNGNGDDNGDDSGNDDDDDDDDVAEPEPLLDQAPDEITVTSLSDDDLATLLTQGFTIVQQGGRDDAPIHRLRIPTGRTLEQSRSDVRALPTGQDADFNHYYRTEQSTCNGPQCRALEQIAFQSHTCSQRDVAIGIIDTSINVDHEVFADRQVTIYRVHESPHPASRALHGTAVAAIIVGDPESRVPGLVPASHLFAVDAFTRERGDERTDAFALVVGLDWLEQQGVEIINMSLAGPDNTALAAAIDRVNRAGIVVVAAAGNKGPTAPPAFPAAYSGVISVTAVDASNNIFAMAQHGPHIDLAAPGVDVWTAASVSGGRLKSGTSYAAPFVSSAAALVLSAEPHLTPDEVIQQLESTALDLGDEGHDEVFGAGLVQIGGWCVNGN